MISPEFRKDWVAALRSGRYEQGNGALCADGRYCCLGVACEINPDIEFMTYGDLTHVDGSRWKGVLNVAGQKNSGMLPEDVLDKIGLSELAQSKLAGMNDQGKSFDYIADVIESGQIPQNYYPPIEI